MNKVEKFWDKGAESFDKEEGRFKAIHDKTIKLARTYLKKNDVVLDYGCATGSKTFDMAPYVKHIQGIDISSRMIEIARKKTASLGVKNVEFIHATIDNEELKKESFDVVTAFNILHTLKGEKQVLPRIIQLLKPGAFLVSVTPCLKEKMKISNRIQLSLYLVLIKLGLFPNILIRFRFPELLEHIERSGLEIVGTEKLSDRMSSLFIVARKV
jgi:ubiquinone/menaquinone biosynthesis C-methylase UbiE